MLGSIAASTLQIPRAGGHVMVDIDGHWFVVIGVLRPVVLDSALNSEVFVSLPVARRVLGAGDHPSELYVLGAVALLVGAIGIANIMVISLALGAGATEVYAATRHEPFVIPHYALLAAPVAGLPIGALAGLYPAAKAAWLSPTEALRA